MAQSRVSILPFNPGSTGIGGSLGSSLGQGIGTGLAALANYKVNQWAQKYERQQFKEAITPLIGPEKAELVSQFDPETRNHILQGLFQPQAQQQQQADQQAAQDMQQQTGIQALQEPQQFKEQYNTQKVLQHLGAPGTAMGSQQDILGQLQRQISGEQPDISQFLQRVPVQAKPVTQPTREETSRVQQPVRTETSRPQKTAADEVREALLKPKPNPILDQRERQHQEKQAFAREKFEEQKAATLMKESKKLREKAFEEKETAEEELEDIKRFKELDTDENLDEAGWYEFLKRSHLNIPALLSGAGEEYEKISQRFIKNAKTYYGGKVSNQEMEQFLRTIPTLSNSPEGRKRIYANMTRLANLKIARYKAIKDISKQNKGNLPRGWEFLVDEKLEKVRDKLAKKFKEDLAKPVRPGPSKFKTAALAGLGSAIGQGGKLAKAAGGAYAGAQIGKLAGPYGAAGGALLGGLGSLFI